MIYTISGDVIVVLLINCLLSCQSNQQHALQSYNTNAYDVADKSHNVSIFTKDTITSRSANFQAAHTTSQQSQTITPTSTIGNNLNNSNSDGSKSSNNHTIISDDNVGLIVGCAVGGVVLIWTLVGVFLWVKCIRSKRKVQAS